MGALVSLGAYRLESGGAGDGLDLLAADAEIGEPVIAEFAKLTDGALVRGELCDLLSNVHFAVPFFLVI